MRRMKPYKRCDRDGWWVRLRIRPGRWTGQRYAGATYEKAIIFQDQQQQRLDQIARGQLDPADERRGEQASRPFAEVLDEYIAHQVGKNLSDRHINESQRVIGIAAAEMSINRLSDWDANKLDRWLENLSVRVSTRTRDLYLTYIKSMIRWAIDRDMMHRSPITLIPQTDPGDTDDTRALSFDEADRLIWITRASKRRRRQERAVMYELCIRTGLRWSEAIRLTWQQFDLAGRWLELKASGTKTKRADVLPLTEPLTESLRLFRPGHARAVDLVFRGGEPTRRTFKADCQRSGVELTTQAGVVRRKSLRPTFITHLALANVPFSTAVKLARHKDPSVTMKHYLKVGLLDLHGAVDQLGYMWGTNRMRENAPDCVVLRTNKGGMSAA